ncbi:MAG TPA: intradiol ring-cleavage dioxygenase [Methylomirabilota bacterium]|nr:intradiol ring-cleavage dioxygenase [Methylomirabilota bacterium]
MNQLDAPLASPVADLDDDDRLIGRILSRREVLAVIGAGGVAAGIAACVPGSGGTGTAATSATAAAAASAGATATATAAASAVVASAGALPSCVVVPELTEGPYYVDVNLERSDIRSNTGDGVASQGAPLELGWVVSQVDGDGCLPMEGAIVDVWHCDALGVYSGVEASTGTDFLRGFQRTDASGAAAFTTVYPGWYQGRAVHIHFKIRTDPDAEAGFEFTSQLFFDDAFSQQVYSSGVYASKGQPDRPNASDQIFNESGGATLLDVSQDGDTYKTTFEIAVQLV